MIPLKDKDKFNATTPNNDAANYAPFVLKPELAHLLNVLYPGLNVPETHRTDIVEGLLTGIPGKTRIAPNAVPADTLKINLGVPPSSSPNRLGVLGGDLAGFPDGRRLTDDVVDISERVVGGFLVGHKLPLGDGVDQNDVPFLTTFPYVASPHDGLHSTLKRIEPVTHPRRRPRDTSRGAPPLPSGGRRTNFDPPSIDDRETHPKANPAPARRDARPDRDRSVCSSPSEPSTTRRRRRR